MSMYYFYSEKSSGKQAHFVDEGLKVKGIKYSNVDTRLLFAPLTKFLATRL